MRNIIRDIYKDPVKIVFGLEKMNLLNWMSDEKYLKLIYRIIYKRKLDLINPKSFTEKINWYKLNYKNPLMKKCADKYEVRKYVEEKIGGKYLNECFGLWKSVEEINYDELPNKFVLKPTNGSGDIVICKDKNTFDWEKAKKTLKKFSKKHFSSKTKEWAYYDLEYRIIGERYIESSDDYQIKDYKFFCFNGEPKFLFVASERGTDDLKFDFFDMNWKYIPVTNGHNHSKNLKKPKMFEEMIEIARKLSENFPHVRVDLYEEEGKIYFGELTFYHFGGITPFEPDSYDYEFGEYFDIKAIKIGDEK